VSASALASGIETFHPVLAAAAASLLRREIAGVVLDAMLAYPS